MAKFKTKRQIQLLKEEKRLNYLNKRIKNIEENPIESITFIKNNGQKIRQPVNPKFFYNEKGNVKSSEQIAKDISSIAHDLGASYLKL